MHPLVTVYPGRSVNSLLSRLTAASWCPQYPGYSTLRTHTPPLNYTRQLELPVPRTEGSTSSGSGQKNCPQASMTRFSLWAGALTIEQIADAVGSVADPRRVASVGTAHSPMLLRSQDRHLGSHQNQMPNTPPTELGRPASALLTRSLTT